MKLQPVERIPYYNTLEAIRIKPFVAVFGPITRISKLSETKHWIILSTQQELVIPVKEWTAIEINNLNPIGYFTRELNRIFGFDIFPDAGLHHANIELARVLAKSLFYPTVFYKPQTSIKLYEFIN